ncbi:MAG: RnfABCDGE type electron transport complex subunit G [Rikenellaceae bacterium]|nr:RnfABCDGE type electron transport complex subunit G [Rikenellaceae bacterium]
MKSSLKNMVLVLFTITAIAALLVGLVNDMTKEAIAQSRLDAKNAAKFSVLSTTATEASVARDTTRTIGDFAVTVSTVVRNDDGSTVGYAVEAPSITKSGYADRIILMVGFIEKEGEAIINNIEVLSQKETPGLGANMTKEGNSLISSVAGKQAKILKFSVAKEGGSFDALTGSTISSRAYANAVETAYAGYLWATGRLDMSSEAVAAAPTGASMPTDESNEWEPEAQEGDMTNE